MELYRIILGNRSLGSRRDVFGGLARFRPLIIVNISSSCQCIPLFRRVPLLSVCPPPCPPCINVSPSCQCLQISMYPPLDSVPISSWYVCLGMLVSVGRCRGRRISWARLLPLIVFPLLWGRLRSVSHRKPPTGCLVAYQARGL